MTQKPKRVNPIRTEIVDDCLHIYLCDHEEPVILNTSAAFVWELCNGKTDLGKISALIQEEYNMPPEVAQDMMWRTLYNLGRAKLLSESLAGPPQLYTRRQFVKILATLGISALLIPHITTAAKTAGIIDELGSNSTGSFGCL